MRWADSPSKESNQMSKRIHCLRTDSELEESVIEGKYYSIVCWLRWCSSGWVKQTLGSYIYRISKQKCINLN